MIDDEEMSLAASLLTGLLGGKAQAKVKDGIIVVSEIEDTADKEGI